MDNPILTRSRLPVILFSAALIVAALSQVFDSWLKDSVIAHSKGSIFIDKAIDYSVSITNFSDLFFPNQSSWFLFNVFHSTRAASVANFVIVVIFLCFVPSLASRFGWFKFIALYVAMSLLAILAIFVF